MRPGHEWTVIEVGLGDRSYPIYAGPGALDDVGRAAADKGFRPPVAVIADDTVGSLYAPRVMHSLGEAGLESFAATFPAGETSKNLKTLASLYDKLAERRVERQSGVIALGGGVAGDMAGFAAATWLRGVPFIQVPTTLLAQVDAAVGGKVGIDHPSGKNLIGAFYQPRAVVIDTLTLKTLPRRQILAGLAEVIKHGVIRDAELFAKVDEWLEKLLDADETVYGEIVPWNCRIKARVVEQDEREGGLRAILNFGHTVGHAVEAVLGYETLLHGEAVAIGMLAEAELGRRLGVTPPDAVDRLRTLLVKAGYPLEKPAVGTHALIEAMYLDKKVQKGVPRFVLPEDIGKVRVAPVERMDLVREVWEDYADWAG